MGFDYTVKLEPGQFKARRDIQSAAGNIANLNKQVADQGGVDKIYGTDNNNNNNKGSMLGDLNSGQLGAIGQGIGGLAQIVSSVAGGRARRQEQAAAREAYRNRMASFEQMDYYGSQPINPFANITVNQLQAEFQARQQQQMAANTMAQLSGAAGGSGIAGLAQALSQQQQGNLAQIAGSIGQQEARNQMAIGQGEQFRFNAQMAAEQRVRDKNETLLALATQRKAIADQARQDATQALVSGIGNVAGAALSFVGAG
tara:strand:+ start:51 stop:821 length:771 start_codon:yes stop_codon:yes gene_type:complete